MMMYLNMRAITRLATSTIIIGICFTIISGCGQESRSSAINEEEWEKGQGELPSRVGEEKDKDSAVPSDPKISPFHVNEEIWKKTEYKTPTGEWFFDEGKGLIGYGLTMGTQKAGDEFSVTFIGHEENGEPMDQDVRIQLTERDGFEIKEIIIEETVHVETVMDYETVYTSFLPEKENAMYLLSAEILNEAGEVEDTRITFIHVPVPEINASLSMDEDVYAGSASEAELILKNDGPTQLFLGTYYSIEKKVDDSWRAVPIETAFTDIGIYLSAGDEHRDTIDLSNFNKGEYRIIKEIQAEGLDLSAVLAAEFTIE